MNCWLACEPYVAIISVFCRYLWMPLTPCEDTRRPGALVCFGGLAQTSTLQKRAASERLEL